MNLTTVPMIPPGDWLGLLGGGQLGRMFCYAAQSLGYQVAVLDPMADCPAGRVADLHIVAAYDDPDGLQRLAHQCRAVTTEFENVPADSLNQLSAHCRVSPSAAPVAIVQNRISEKGFIAGLGIPVVPHAVIRSEADVLSADAGLFPGILKVARLGYDGKGQARIQTQAQALAAFVEFGRVACVLEAFMPLKEEISVVVARSFEGQSVTFPLARNVHREGILAVSTVTAIMPGTQHAEQQARATKTAETIAQGLNYHGVLCVEFFVLQDGRLIVNEIAPRPHNSGHYTQDACLTSQFEQQVRVMAGLPLGSTRLLAPAIMLNVLGDLWFASADATQPREPDWASALRTPTAKLHLYGKREARRGRKMGHINIVAPSVEEALAQATQVAQALGMRAPE